MNNLSIFAVSILFSLNACRNADVPKDPKPETPKALNNEPSFSSEIEAYRGSRDLVEALYAEQVGKNPELKKVENEMQALREAYVDSLQSFSEFNSHNSKYFEDVNEMANKVTDSLMRGKLRSLIDIAMAENQQRLANHNLLKKTIDTSMANARDLHSALKIYTTLKVMRKYQEQNVPSIRPLKELTEKTNETNSHFNKIIAK